MAYYPSVKQRPSFVKACADRKRFVADIMRAVKDSDDYKVLFEHIFPDKAAPHVKLPDGYRDVLQGALLDGAEISDESLENVRSNLMEELRKKDTKLSQKLSKKTRGTLEKVVMVTSPEWVSTFRPTEDLHEDFTDRDATKEPLPVKDMEMLHGPVTYIFLLLGVMIISFVVRMLLAASQSSTDDSVLRMGLGAIYQPGKALASRSINSAKYSVDMAPGVESLIRNQLAPPQMFNSFGMLPGFILYELMQVATVLIYLALMPFILIVANTAKMFSVRNMEFVESVESMLFQFNKGYTKQLRFKAGDKNNLVKLLFGKNATLRSSGYYSLDEIVNEMKSVVAIDNNARMTRLLEGKYEGFVKQNMKRFMRMNEEPGDNYGKYQITEDAVLSATDSYNLLDLNGANMAKLMLTIPDFLSKMGQSAFSYPMLVKVSETEFKFVPNYYFETYTVEYLKVPHSYPEGQVPQFTFDVRKNISSGSLEVKQMRVKFPGGIELEDSLSTTQNTSNPIYGSSNSQDTGKGSRYLEVRNETKSDSSQSMTNMAASFLRSVGVYAGFLGSASLVLLVLLTITRVLDNMFGSYISYRNELFERKIFVTSDAYYNWIDRSDVNREDVSKMNTFITRTNVHMKIVDMSKLNNDEDKVKELIDVYNKDVGTTTFIRNQMFTYVMYLLCLITIPYVLPWLAGLGSSRLAYNMLAPMGLDGGNMYLLGGPVVTLLIMAGCFVSVVIYMSQRWFKEIPQKKDGKKDPKDRRYEWKTTSDMDDSDMTRAPMKVNMGKKHGPTRHHASKTLRFLTANGSYCCGLEQDSQQTRVLQNNNIFNATAFERSRVMFITNSDDLHGYYLKFIRPVMKDHHKKVPVDNSIKHMKMNNYGSSTTSLYLNSLIAVGVVSGVLIFWPMIKSVVFSGAQSGIQQEQGNILKNALPVMKLLEEYVGDLKHGSNLMYILGGQAAMVLATLWPIMEIASSSKHISTATHTTAGGKMEATELAYGSLPYIDGAAHPEM